MHGCMHTCTREYMHTCTHTCIYACMHTEVYCLVGLPKSVAAPGPGRATSPELEAAPAGTTCYSCILCMHAMHAELLFMHAYDASVWKPLQRLALNIRCAPSADSGNVHASFGNRRSVYAQMSEAHLSQSLRMRLSISSVFIKPLGVL